MTYTVIIYFIYGLVIRGVTLQELLDGAALTTGDGVDIHGNAADIQPAFILIIEDVEECVFTEVSLILQQDIEIAVRVIVTIDTAADNLHIHNTHIGIHTGKNGIEMLPNRLQHLIGGKTIQTADML